MGFMDSIKQLNPWYKKFDSLKTDTDSEDIEDVSVGKTEDELIADGSFHYSYVDFRQNFESKTSKIRKYREMSKFSEIMEAVDMICDDAVVENEVGDIAILNFKEELPKRIEEKIRNIFDRLLIDVFRINHKGWDLFEKWLIESELYLEIVLDKKGKKIIGVKLLPAHTMTPEYKGNLITAFYQRVSSSNGEEELIPFQPNQILYTNYGKYGRDLTDVKGYLEPAVRPYNQLRNLEDSLVIYRLVRAPERRIFNIDVGRMPKGKAEEYIKNLINKYKKRLNYDADTGKLNSSQSIQALTEDFWFAKTETGGSTVDNLSSGMNLGELEDVKYFLQKLQKSLKVPKSRWEENQPFSSGKIGEITRDEIKFSNFVLRLQNRFKRIFIDALLLQLKLMGFERKYLREDIYDIKMVQMNLFKEYKERDLVQSKLDIWGTVSSYVLNKQNWEEGDGVFSKEFVMKKWVGMSDEEYEENEMFMSREKKELKKQIEEEEEIFETDDEEESEESSSSPEPSPEEPEESDSEDSE